MTTLTQNTITGTLVFVSIQTPQTKYQSTEKEFKAGVVVDEDTADAWNEQFPKQTAKVVKTTDFKDTYKIDAPFPEAKKQYVITLKKPAQYADGTLLPKQYLPKVLVQEGNVAVDVTDSQLPANGSVGKISFEVRDNSYGTFAKLRNVLVTTMIEYKKGGGNAGDDFGLEVQGGNDFQEEYVQPEQPKQEVKDEVKPQPKPKSIPKQVEEDLDDNHVPF